jgi:hypothetical protein
MAIVNNVACQPSKVVLGLTRIASPSICIAAAYDTADLPS